MLKRAHTISLHYHVPRPNSLESSLCLMLLTKSMLTKVKKCSKRSFRVSSLFFRMWEKVSSVVMIYIENSNERPFGEIVRIWWRYEFQTTQGNLPHIHCLVWVNDCKTSPPCQDRVVLTKSQLLYSLESEFLQTIGLVDDKDAAFALYKDAVRMHFHSCPASNYRCHKKTIKMDRAIVDILYTLPAWITT